MWLGGVGGRTDPPDGRKSVRDFSLDTTWIPPGYHLCSCLKIDHWLILKKEMKDWGDHAEISYLKFDEWSIFK